MSASIGITSWIKGSFLRGVAFKRKTTRTGHTKHGGQELGRRVDQFFKQWCTTRKMPAGQHAAAIRMRHVASAMAAARLQPVRANVFVKQGRLKTHIDGVATDCSNNDVVIELKSTQATAAEHIARYNTPCSNKPMTPVGPNTEALHHRLQAAFGMRALGVNHGVVIVACADRAIIYPVDEKPLPETIFATVQMRKGEDHGSGVPRWPKPATRGLPPAYKVKNVAHKQVARLIPSGAAIALPVAPSACPRAMLGGAKGMLKEHPAPHFFVWPKNGQWQAVSL